MPSRKALLAEALFDTPIFDVSPGEMLCHLLDQFFGAPRPGLTIESAREYGSLLAGVCG